MIWWPVTIEWIAARSIAPALEARNSKAQGEGAQRRKPGYWDEYDKALKGRHKQPVSPLQGSIFILACSPSGWKSPLPRTLPPWASLFRAFSVTFGHYLFNCFRPLVIFLMASFCLLYLQDYLLFQNRSLAWQC
jgi:hypothetical protein